jgi:hypothetical protein
VGGSTGLTSLSRNDIKADFKDVQAFKASEVRAA